MTAAEFLFMIQSARNAQNLDQLVEVERALAGWRSQMERITGSAWRGDADRAAIRAALDARLEELVAEDSAQEPRPYIRDEAKADGHSLAAQRLRAKVATPHDDGLAKPDHVEEGQMWTRLDDYRTIELVRANSDVDFDNGRWERAETLLTSPNWRYIGMKEKR